jgi:Xaa-Pro aminopeptidase
MRRLLSIAAVLLLPALAAAAAPGPETGPPLFAARRAKLLSNLPAGAVAILHAAPESAGERESYRQDSGFWYLTGFPEVEAVAVLAPGAPEGKRYTLFVRPKEWEREQWIGYRAGPDGAKATYAADEAFPVEEFPKQLGDLLRDATSLWVLDGGDTKFRDTVVSGWSRRAALEKGALPLYDLAPTVADMRLVKDATEIALLRQAVALTVNAHRAAMRLAQPGNGEWVMAGAMVGTCLSGGAARMAYPPIVGSGPNSVILHYDASSRVLKAGDMIVNDTACEVGMYAADVTRSYPAGGTFSPQQKAIYEIVLRAQKAAQAKSVPGAEMREIYDATVDVIVDGLLSLGLLSGDKAEIVAKKSYRTFYPHGSSHWLGLDVHDAGSYESERIPPGTPQHMRRFAPAHAKLRPGMAFTIEPGIYVPEKAEGVDPKWWNIGVRIEDDFLVTPKGVECLSCALPREIADLKKAIRR